MENFFLFHSLSSDDLTHSHYTIFELPNIHRIFCHAIVRSKSDLIKISNIGIIGTETKSEIKQIVIYFMVCTKIYNYSAASIQKFNIDIIFKIQSHGRSKRNVEFWESCRTHGIQIHFFQRSNINFKTYIFLFISVSHTHLSVLLYIPSC